jgi:DNA-binding transcriptional LysR family regulator
MSDDRLFSRDLDWNLFKVFDQIVQSGGLSAAARRMPQNQPALSLALKRLEERLEITLCRRGPGGFELLVEGELVAETSREIAQLAEDLPSKLADITKTVRGVLHLRTLCDIVCCELDESLRRFNMRYPNVQIRTDIGAEDTIVQTVLHNQTDIGIDTNRVQIAGLVYEPLFREAHQAFCGRDFHLFGERIRGLANHADEPFLLTEVDEPKALKKFRAETGVGRNTVARSNNLAELRRLAILGLGICFLPDHFAAPDVEAGRLWPLTPDCQDWGLDIYMITNPDAPRQQLQRLFIDEVRAVKAEMAEASG